MIGIQINIKEVIEETSMIEIGDMTEVGTGIEMTGEDLGGIEVIVDLGIEVGN